MRDVPLELLGNCPVEPCPHGEVLTADEDVAAAAKELEAGDLRHAAHHVAAALAVDPLKPEHRALCDRLLAAAPDGPALFPLAPPVFAGNLVGHACALHRQAHTGRALPLLVQAARARPGPAYLGLAAEWMSTPAHLKRPKAQELVQLLEPWVGEWILSRVTLSPALRRDLEAFRPALEQLLKLHASSGQLQLLGATYLRLLGRTAMAVTVAARAHTAATTFHTCAALGLAHQAKGEVAPAIRLFRKALELDPSSTGLELELGDLHVDLGQPAGALAYYARAEEKTGPTPFIEAGRLAARAKKTGDPAALDGLRRLARGDPPLERAREWLEKLGHPLPRPTPYVDHLPDATEASLNLLRKVVLRSSGKTAGVLLNAAVDGIEPPSAQLAFGLLAQELGMQTTIRVARVQEPDPREPAAEVAHRLWRWEGTHAHPALDPPTPEVAAAVAEVARHPFSLATWAEPTRALAERLGPEAVPQLLAVMVHPPPSPDPDVLVPDRWLLRVQQAAALVLAQVEPGWAGSRRRAALHALVHGPSDWTVAAAVVATGHVAAGAPEVVAELFVWLGGLLARLPATPCCWRTAALVTAQRLAALPDGLRAQVEALAAGPEPGASGAGRQAAGAS